MFAAAGDGACVLAPLPGALRMALALIRWMDLLECDSLAACSLQRGVCAPPTPDLRHAPTCVAAAVDAACLPVAARHPEP